MVSESDQTTTASSSTGIDSLPILYKWIIKIIVILMTFGGFALAISVLISVSPLCIIAGIVLMYVIND
jgi:hypothetical protein